MAKMEWSDALSVKVMAFDRAHKKLVEMINKLHDAMSQGQARNLVPNLLTELLNYTKTHFREEETMFDKHNYPKSNEHKKNHETFITKVKEMADDYNRGNITVSIPLCNLLITWLTSHIQKEDQAYSDFMNKKGEK